ncbi:hypothetical protein [Actinoplanes sp. TFC3]|uniref:hypothetical protein n=1 Tax=Actinoplanes sp. TFC3 TaxID=1710355 RepID=UPI00082BC54C|nr:hypothetical protein [Actinoplanes sp. TFC3]
MSIDFGYPNDEAIDKIGVLADHDKSLGHDAGWTRSVIKKIEADIMNSPQHKESTGGSFDRSDYDQDELAAWDWYRSDVVDTDHWESLVKDYKADVTDESNVKPDGYNGDKQYVPYTEPKVEGSNVPYSGSNNANKELAVSTEALKYFANQIDAIVKDDGTGMLTDARNKLKAVQMKPGGFAKAEVLRQKIDGVSANDAGLRGDSMGMLLAVQEALLAVKSGLLKMANEYEKAEDFNSMTAEQLTNNMDGAWGKISDVGDYGQSSGTTAGGK